MVMEFNSSRGDTFRIRSYGDVRDPVTDELEAQVWCEFIVQRTPNWIDEADDPKVEPSTLSRSVNHNFGRRYKVVSFRWLAPDEV